MAIPNKYIDKITDQDSGESRPICPPAEHVSVDNENFEGETLDEVLGEVARSIEEAGQGGYAPPEGGIPKTDLAQSVQGSLDKADSALQDEDVAEVAKTGDYNDLEHKPTIPDTSNLATKTELATKQDKISAGNGIAIAQDGKTVSVDAEVVQPVTADGTFTIRIGNNTYTINLNHSHENMAKLVVCEESDLPSTLEEDTIYGVEEDGEISVLYVGGIPFYGGGGGTSTPVLRQPTDGTTIDVGNIASGQSSVSKTITIKGKSLTQALTVAVTGTGYSVDKQSIPAADANIGTTLTITCTNTNGISAGTLSIASSEVSCDCDLVAYEDLIGVKLTGTQWLQTDYHPNPNTEFELTCHFEANSHTNQLGANKSFLKCVYDTNTCDERFSVYTGTTGEYNYSAYRIFCLIKKGSASTLAFDDEPGVGIMTTDNAVLRYAKGSSNGTFSFTAGGSTKSVQAPLQTETISGPMQIGYNPETSDIYNAFNLTIYELTITENRSVVHHWVPKLKNGTITGLFDTVTGKFISSETTTELVAIS